MTCPRAIEDGRPNWNENQPPEFVVPPHEDGTCDYCGSWDADDLMARLEAGTVILGPTDKSYKVYLTNAGGAPFKQSARRCPKDATCKGPGDCTHYETRETDSAKFYFQHLSEAQMRRFVELLNERKLKIDGGGFYVRPFFITFGPKAES